MEQLPRSVSTVFWRAPRWDKLPQINNVETFPLSHCGRLARRLIETRNFRREHFKATLFSEPAWDILLQLFVAQCEQRRIYVSQVAARADIPTTTLLRWLSALEQEALIVRSADSVDKRRTYLKLTNAAMQSMRDYLHGL